MRVVHASYSDDVGGAARAAYRIHRSLVGNGVDSRMIVDRARSGDWTVEGPSHLLDKVEVVVKPRLENRIVRLQRTTNRVLHSPAVLPGWGPRRLRSAGPDIVNLHWLGGGYASVRQVGRLQGPAVWTLHDMWAFCGAEHYAPDGPDDRWRVGYRRGNRDDDHSGLDIDRWVWRRKCRLWRRPFHVVAPSHWIGACASQSALLSSWPVTVIPYPVPIDRYQPHPPELARRAFGLPLRPRLLLFGALGGTTDPRKGWDLLEPALARAAAELTDLEIVVLGQSEPRTPPRFGLPTHWVGELHDDAALALLYSAVDAAVVPSRQDNLPQGGVEPQACGTPVVGFQTAGMPDVVAHRQTGYLATPFDSDDLARGIVWVLEDRNRHAQLSEASRERAVQLWGPRVIATQYQALYRDILESGTLT